MKINSLNNYNNNVTFTRKPNADEIEKAREIGEKILHSIRNSKRLVGLSKGETPKYLEWIAGGLKKLIPGIEKNVIQSKKDDPTQGKRTLEDLVNFGNIAKELACMIVYPAQVLTNPDLPKDKRRFIGMYDFFVTCFSLGGTLLFAWKGNKLSKQFAGFLMSKYKNGAKANFYPNAKRAIEGGAFVVGIAVQTILFKRILAPALSPPLAGVARKHWEAKDAKKLKAQGKTVEDKKPEETKNSSILIPPENDVALNMQNKDSNLIKSFIEVNK